MQESPSPELLTRLAAWLGAGLLGGGGFLGWLKYRLEKERQFVELGLIAAQTKEHEANAHKITVEGLIQAANERRMDLERVTKDRDYWKDRAEKCERRPLEKRLARPRPGGKGK